MPGPIEITAGKSKTRQRRLVEICPALAVWLEDFRQLTGKVCPITAASIEKCFSFFIREYASKEIISEREGSIGRANTQ